jgi:hypothetical protein
MSETCGNKGYKKSEKKCLYSGVLAVNIPAK